MRLRASLLVGGLAAALLPFGIQARAAGDDALPLTVPPGVTLQDKYYADGEGKALYTSDKDVTPGKSSCVAECAATWRPLAAPERAKASGAWSLVRREGGVRQWAFNGKPVYTFANDTKVGEASGNGADNGAWHTLTIKPDDISLPAGFAVREVAEAGGRALVDHRGVTLYTFIGKSGKGAQSSLSREWTPVSAAAIANPTGDFSIMRSVAGGSQWAYKGKPLYLYSHDVAPNEAKGVGASPAMAAALVARNFMPADVVVRTNPGQGTILATASGTTLYMLDGFRYQVGTHHTRDASRGVPATGRLIGTRGCENECLHVRRPFVAPADAAPSGHWTILTRDDGTRQWAYRGYALYTFTGDRKPGDMLGNDVYQVRVSQVASAVIDPTLPISLNWHVVYP
jgi:predicted lipoprotein with Yx(FWY)xxD motif